MSSFLRGGGAALLLLGLACQGAPAPEAAPTIEGASASETAPFAEAVPDRMEAARLQAAFAAALKPEAGLSFEALERRHSPAFLPRPTFHVTDAAHYQGFVDAFRLTGAERERLRTLGFVVVPARGPGGAGPVDVYYRVFAADLPVFVSADSVLHAWHRSYEEILQLTEELVLFDALTELLDRVRAALDPADPAQRDARLHVDVARMLLEDYPSLDGGALEELRPIVEAIREHRRTEIELMGQRIEHDFSQLKPRGHYNRTAQLQRYFKAMMWLGRTELRLYDPERGAAPNPREEAAARALVAALARSGQHERFDELERFYRLHVGRPNALTPSDLARLCDEAGAPECASEPTPGAMAEQYRVQGRPAFSSSPDPDVVAMRLFPQRFAYDAWVTHQTTWTRLPEVDHRQRTMATPYDVAFALGSDRALLQLRAERGEPWAAVLSQHLSAARRTMQTVPPLELDETIYNHWLQALRVVARTDLDERLPQVMRTAAWHDHRLETLLASWAELRHDTVLAVEQSEGVFGCQYPQGYVEPLPELYRQLDQATAHLMALYEGGVLGGSPVAKAVSAWGEHFRATMQRLVRLSEQQLRGEPMSADDLAFMNATVDRHADDAYGGTRNYDGWYPALYWNLGWTLERRKGADLGLGGTYPHTAGGESEPIVADVHTDARRRTALEVATGHPELLVVAIDQGGDVAVYGGPASSFYAFEKPTSQRMSDEEWRKAIDEHALPSRPDFARGYRAE